MYLTLNFLATQKVKPGRLKLVILKSNIKRQSTLFNNQNIFITITFISEKTFLYQTMLSHFLLNLVFD